MIHYQLPPTLNQDISRFQGETAAFNHGELHETAFKAKRVKMGVYQERGDQTHMIRIRCAGNVITPQQLVKVAELGAKYGKARVHVTTRSELQIHHVQLDNVLSIIEELKQVGLSTKGGGGNTTRNIYTNPDSGINPNDVFDVQPYAIALTSRLIAEVDSFELPRKFKTAFSSLADDAAYCTVQDLGFIAKINEKGEKGFAVYVGGGLGAKPKVGIVLHDFIPENKLFHVTKAIKIVFHEHGDRRNKHHSRIRFLIHDDLGVDHFKELYQAELDKIYDDSAYEMKVIPIDNSSNLNREIDLQPLAESVDGYNLWYQRNVKAQQQYGLFSFRLPLHLGDLSTDDCIQLEKILRPFGDNVLRCNNDQNFYVRNIPGRYLKNVYQGIKSLYTLSAMPFLFGNLIPCTGAQTCKLGINYPRPASMAIFKHLEQQAIDYDLLDDIRIHISGCPNSCANHWKGDLGFFGKVRRKNGHSIPTYNVMGGAKIIPGQTEIAQYVGWLHSRDLPKFLAKVLEHYQSYKKENGKEAVFYSFWQDSGKELVRKLCKEEFNDIPSFEEDKNYYFDHGGTEIFTIKNMGKAECSAGIYDMLDVDSKAIKANVKIISDGIEEKEELVKTLRDTLFFSSRMFLVTRGEEPQNDRETYNSFLKHFIDKGIVSAEYRNVIELVREGSSLIEHQEAVIGLGKVVVDLYKNMDNTMRFPGEKENLAINMDAKPKAPVAKIKILPEIMKEAQGVVEAISPEA